MYKLNLKNNKTLLKIFYVKPYIIHFNWIKQQTNADFSTESPHYKLPDFEETL